MAPLNVLISGSGIAGGVFANCLLRAHPNANITIVERDPELRLTGASVDIRSSAVEIIKWMGAEQEIRDHTTKEEGMEFVRGDGKPIISIKATGREDVQSMTSEFEIFRGALSQIFIGPVLDKVNMIFDETVDTYEQKGDRVDVTFTKSKETKSYDLLVAADGLGSKIRGTILNAKPRDQIHDEGAHVAYWTVKKDILDGGRMAKWYNTTGGRGIFLRPDPNPEGRTRAHFVNVTWKSQKAERERLNDALKGGHESYMRLMEELYQDAGWMAPEVLKSMRESDDFYCSLFAQVRSPRIQDGRVILLGDAGYATPGIGTSLAIIGGYVLAGELLTTPDDIPAASERYEAYMLPFVKSQQGNDIAMQLLNPQTQWGLYIRNTILGFITMFKLDVVAITLASKLGIGESKTPMPKYDWPTLDTEKAL